MKIMTYTYPKSSFLSVEKDMDIIVNMILKNERLKKLLYYTTKDCLDKPNLTEDESLELFGKNIKIVPEINIEDTLENYLIIKFDNFTPNDTNPEFRDNIIELDILCPLEACHLRDFKLRPFLIAAELDSMLEQRRLSGIGKTQFAAAATRIFNQNYFLLCLAYKVIHGEEDKKNTLNPADNKDIIENFDKVFNDK